MSGSPRSDHLDRPGLRPLWDELVRRFGEGSAPSTITLRDLTLDEQRAVADLLGSDRLPRPPVRLRVDRLVTELGLADVHQLRALLEAHRGLIPDRRAARQARRQARQELWDWLAGEAGKLHLADGSAGLEAWVEDVRAAGVPQGDVAAHRRRLEGVVRVLRALPGDGTSLAGLADDVLGDTHALDHGKMAARLVLDAAATALGRERPADAESARLLWETVGVVPDPLSSTVLALGLRLRPSGEDPLARWLQSLAEVSEPAVLTLAQLRRWPLPPLNSDEIAYVVENPSIVAEAADRGWSGPPLVCSSGRPSVAVVTLLRQLGAAGAILRQHADFDRGGLGITAWLTARAGTVPWRMTADDYLRALAVERPRPRLASGLPPTRWDGRLRPTMESRGVAVHEEELRASLLSAMTTT